MANNGHFIIRLAGKTRPPKSFMIQIIFPASMGLFEVLVYLRQKMDDQDNLMCRGVNWIAFVTPEKLTALNLYA